jgi:hypothetical protein
MLIAGAGWYFIAMQPASAPSIKKDDDAARMMQDMMAEAKKPGVNPGEKKVNPLDVGPKIDKSNNTDVTPKSSDEIVKAALKQMNDSCLAGDRQRSKPYCRQLSAEACAMAGDPVAADAHLKQLIVVGGSVPYYRIDPNLDLFWIAWKAGDKKLATTRLNAAVEDARQLPKVGRHQLEVASRLAAALVVAGRIPEGIAALEGHQTPDLEGQLSARLQMATDGRLSRLTSVRTVVPWDHPQAAAAAGSLVNYGQMTAARDWAKAHTNEDVRPNAWRSGRKPWLELKRSPVPPTQTQISSKSQRELTRNWRPAFGLARRVGVSWLETQMAHWPH